MSRYNCNYNYNYNTASGCSTNYNVYGAYSNRVVNPGMEYPIDTDGTTRNWDVSGGVERTSIPSLVHTGNYAVMLNEGSNMSQTLFRLYPSRQYEFSFFAKYGSKKEEGKKDKDKDNDKGNDEGKDGKEEKKGPDHSKDLALRATVTFVNRNMKMQAVEMNIPAGSISDDYVYYRALTPITPPDVIAAIVRFDVSEPQVHPHVPHHLGVLIDDVNFSRH